LVLKSASNLVRWSAGRLVNEKPTFLGFWTSRHHFLTSLSCKSCHTTSVVFVCTYFWGALSKLLGRNSAKLGCGPTSQS
jgi:hypothetical protein